MGVERRRRGVVGVAAEKRDPMVVARRRLGNNLAAVAERDREAAAGDRRCQAEADGAVAARQIPEAVVGAADR